MENSVSMSMDIDSQIQPSGEHIHLQKKLSGQDQAVIETSNDALVTKVNAASLGYFQDNFSHLFCKTKKKMFPIINRGTWARVFSIKQITDRFLKAYGATADRLNILSLGAGYDTTVFQLQEQIQQGKLPESLKGKVTVVEVDFHEVVAKKIQIIKSKQNLIDLFKTEAEKDINVIHERHINSHQYKLFSQDLRETDILQQNFLNLGVDFNAPTLVITECLLVYMKKQDTDKILSALSSMFANDLMYVNYEMIHPGDAFGRVMIENLEDRGCQLLGIHDCPNEDFQIERMKTAAGMTSAECYNMSQIYSKKLDQTERARVDRLEIFDEFEEWELLQKHYCVCFAKRIADPTLDAQIFL